MKERHTVKQRQRKRFSTHLQFPNALSSQSCAKPGATKPMGVSWDGGESAGTWVTMSWCSGARTASCFGRVTGSRSSTSVWMQEPKLCYLAFDTASCKAPLQQATQVTTSHGEARLSSGSAVASWLSLAVMGI